MSNEQNNASPVEFGCHCDLEPGMPPDGCVLDEGKPENCVHARRFSSKEQCAYWKPITPPAAAPAPAVPQGVIYEKADSLYKRGYTDRQTGKDYDPRGCDEWQEVVDWLTPAAPVQEPAAPRGWHIAITGGDEVVVRAPSNGPGAMTIPSGSDGALPVRLLDALCRALLSAPSQEPAVPQGNDPAWTLAAKVRESLDRKACPGYYMDVAVEAVVHNYAAAAPSQPSKYGSPELQALIVAHATQSQPVTLTDNITLLEEVSCSLEDYKNGAPWGGWDRVRLEKLNNLIAALREKEQTK